MMTIPVFRVFKEGTEFKVLVDGGSITLDDPKDIKSMLNDWLKDHKEN